MRGRYFEHRIHFSVKSPRSILLECVLKHRVKANASHRKFAYDSHNRFPRDKSLTRFPVGAELVYRFLSRRSCVPTKVKNYHYARNVVVAMADLAAIHFRAIEILNWVPISSRWFSYTFIRMVRGPFAVKRYAGETRNLSSAIPIHGFRLIKRPSRRPKFGR